MSRSPNWQKTDAMEELCIPFMLLLRTYIQGKRNNSERKRKVSSDKNILLDVSHKDGIPMYKAKIYKLY